MADYDPEVENEENLDLVIFRNGWLYLNRKQKYGNTPPIRYDKIDYFNFYTTEKGEEKEKHYIIFYIGNKEAKWLLKNRDDTIEIYTYIIEMFLEKKSI